MNLCYPVIPVTILLSFTNIKPVTIVLTNIYRMAQAAVASQLEVLLNRLNEAERRVRILKTEIKSIKEEISTLRQNVTGIQNENLSSSTILGAQLFSERRTILLDNLPNTSTVDGFTSYKRTLEGLVNESTNNKKSKLDFVRENGYIVVYTDGACENNGKPDAKAGIGVWFGEEHPLNISKPVEGRATNNTAEIQACVQALQVIKDQGENKVKILTDSQFTINCMTKWIQNWKKNNWKTSGGGSVKNKEDLQILDNIIQTFLHVKLVHVAGHNGIKGNEEADRLARQGALRYKKPLGI